MTRIIAAIALIAVVALTFAATSHTEAAASIQGDATCDGRILPADAAAVLADSAGFPPSPCASQGDVNCDSSETPVDALRLIGYLAGIDFAPVSGCPPIGADLDSGETASPTPTSIRSATLSPPPGPTFTATPTATETPVGETQPPTSTPPANTLTPTPTVTPTTHTPTPTPTTHPTNTPKPGQTPRVGDEPNCQVFPANNWWNTDISNFPLDPNSDDYVDFVGRSTHLHPDVGTVWDGAPIGIPYVIVGGNQPKVPITYYYGDSDPGPYPIPPNAPVEGQPAGSPNTASFGGDRHVLVIDETNCKLYETFDSHPVNNGASWTTGSAAFFDLNSNALRPDTWTSADAAGLPIFAGLIRYSEVQTGVIDHALRFTVHDTQHAFIHPATHEASDTTDPDAPPMGLRFRMKASYDCSWASQVTQIICTALKKYGMFVADNGSDWYISGAPDSRWDDDALGDIKSITGNAFEVVDTGEDIIIPPPD